MTTESTKRTTLAGWEAAVAKSLKGATLESMNWITPEGLTVKPLYTAADIQGLPDIDTLPGFEPYVRGPQATMYCGRPWTIRQYAGFSTATTADIYLYAGASN